MNFVERSPPLGLVWGIYRKRSWMSHMQRSLHRLGEQKVQCNDEDDAYVNDKLLHRDASTRAREAVL